MKNAIRLFSTLIVVGLIAAGCSSKKADMSSDSSFTPNASASTPAPTAPVASAPKANLGASSSGYGH